MRFLVLLSVVFVASIVVAGCTSQSSSTGSSGAITKSVDDILPSRADIPTEFVMDSSVDVSLTDLGNSSGFEGGKTVSTSKLEGIAGIIYVSYNVYKFSASQDAKSWYDKRIKRIKENGGYTEIGVSGCFAYKENLGGLSKTMEAICMKSNVVYTVTGTAENTIRPVDTYVRNGVSTLNSKLL